MGQTDGGPKPGAPGGTSEATPGDPVAGGGSRQRRQQAGFSVFLDQVLDEAGAMHWESRLYHAESGAETAFAGASPDQWIGWILDRIANAGGAMASAVSSPSLATVEVASVELREVTFITDDPTSEGSLHTMKAQLVVQLTGVARLEREIGSRVLRGMAGPDR